MATTISKYYKDELIEWNNSILFYRNEIREFGAKLAEVIRRNSIVGIAQKVEAFQIHLNLAADNFYRLQVEIQQQEESLRTNGTLINDTSVDDKMYDRQVELRRKMHEAEKHYIDVKFNCYNFLSETLQKKKS
jgi:hypothetical protein